MCPSPSLVTQSWALIPWDPGRGSGPLGLQFWAAPSPEHATAPAEQQMLQVRCSASHLVSLRLSSETQLGLSQ